MADENSSNAFLFITRSPDGKYFCHCKTVIRILSKSEREAYTASFHDHEVVEPAVTVEDFDRFWKDKVTPV